MRQNHRDIKSCIGPMLGLKDVDRGAIKIAGIKLLHRIRKEQFAIRCPQGQTASDIWNAVLSA